MLALSIISFLWGPWLIDVLHFLMVCLKQSWRKSVLNIRWKDWCWSWNSNTLATWWEGLTHWKRSWCWERLKTGEGNDRGWDGWMASLTQWTWVWASSWSWWWTGRPGMLQLMGSQRVRDDWATELKCHTSAWIGHRHMHAPSLWNLPPFSHQSPASAPRYHLVLRHWVNWQKVWRCLAKQCSATIFSSSFWIF